MNQKLVLGFLRIGLITVQVYGLIHKLKELQILLKTPAMNKEYIWKKQFKVPTSYSQKLQTSKIGT